MPKEKCLWVNVEKQPVHSANKKIFERPVCLDKEKLFYDRKDSTAEYPINNFNESLLFQE